MHYSFIRKSRNEEKDDLDGENNAIKIYREQITLCAKLGDTTTRLMLEEIVSDEEGHADT